MPTPNPAEGQQPTQTVYQTELDKLRKQIYAVLNKTTTTFEEFSALLMQEHGIAVKGEPRPVELLPARSDKVHHRQETEQEAGKRSRY